MTGSAWALRWLLDSGLIRLDSPLGGAERLPQKDVGDVCCICLDGFLSPITLPCGHKSCRACIRRWFTTRIGPARCPMCNQDVAAPEDVLPQNLLFALADDLTRHAPWLPPGASAPSMMLGDVLAALAAYRGALALLELLKEEGIDMARTIDGTNLMHVACMNRQSHIVRWLAATGYAHLSLALSHDGRRPIEIACDVGDVCTLELLRSLPTFVANHELKALRGIKCELQGLLGEECGYPTNRDVQNISDHQVSCLLSQLAKQMPGEAARLRERLEQAEHALHTRRSEAAGISAAASGWVEAALGSKHKRVARLAIDYRRHASAEEALVTTLPRLMQEGAPLTKIVTLGADLSRSRIAQAADWRAPSREFNPWLKIIVIATEHARADVLRWLYSDQDKVGLAAIYAFDRPIEDHGSGSYETYEDFGRGIAARCDEPIQREFNSLYDDLRLAKEAAGAWVLAREALLAALGCDEYGRMAWRDQGPALSLNRVLHASDRVTWAYHRFPAKLRPRHVRTGEALLDPPEQLGSRDALVLRVEGLGGFFCRNFCTINASLPLVRWFVEEMGSTEQNVLRMLALSVQHTRRPGAIEVQAYLIRWLSDRGIDVSREAFGYLSLDDNHAAPSSRSHTILDIACRNVMLFAPRMGYGDEAVALCWKSIEKLMALMPNCPLTHIKGHIRDMCEFFSGLTPGEDRSKREADLIRFLQLAEAAGAELAQQAQTDPSEAREKSIPQYVFDGGWMRCLRWLAEERGVDIQSVTIDPSAVGWSGEADLGRAELLRVQRAQRVQHAET
mmetsp:Transcript_19468/g.55230  ORF Transcript_19468/g.55230 Transcript_19468/m.55230 type:complete len:792 (+) Transcript_19468:2-2377(+)